jgi:hypothetical protein
MVMVLEVLPRCGRVFQVWWENHRNSNIIVPLFVMASSYLHIMINLS